MNDTKQQNCENADGESRQVEQIVSCPNCNGTGTISYNPNLNPNFFPGTAFAKCTRWNGSGYEDKGN